MPCRFNGFGSDCCRVTWLRWRAELRKAHEEEEKLRAKEDALRRTFHQEKTTQEQKIAELENALHSERRARYDVEQDMAEEIRRLREQLADLTGVAASPSVARSTSLPPTPRSVQSEPPPSRGEGEVQGLLRQLVRRSIAGVEQLFLKVSSASEGVEIVPPVVEILDQPLAVNVFVKRVLKYDQPLAVNVFVKRFLKYDQPLAVNVFVKRVLKYDQPLAVNVFVKRVLNPWVEIVPPVVEILDQPLAVNVFVKRVLKYDQPLAVNVFVKRFLKYDQPLAVNVFVKRVLKYDQPLAVNVFVKRVLKYDQPLAVNVFVKRVLKYDQPLAVNVFVKRVLKYDQPLGVNALAIGSDIQKEEVQRKVAISNRRNLIEYKEAELAVFGGELSSEDWEQMTSEERENNRKRLLDKLKGMRAERARPVDETQE
ncbi:predicted protein [Nematostella vectensis]|uniref:Uncharacterized protein n=1 Tax=Nematostella vectensis TaxID=45351 RepID=A7SAE9_NEMVE|nr:predicted protein [Nematostella vectensis]|eukprot:XP_001631328.1 predicted protein [Nematostella vectensis]